MRKITQLALSILIVVILAFNASAYENEPKVFRGIKWGTAIEDIKDMELEQDGGNMKFYIRKDDKKKIGDAVVDQITYGFYNGKFFWVFLRFKSISNFVHLKDTFFQQYGPGNKRNRFMENYYWGVNDDVYINFKYNEASERGQILYLYNPISKEMQSTEAQKAKEAKDDL